MNKTLKLTIAALVLATVICSLSAVLSSTGGNALPTGCDYYSEPTIATQYINDAALPDETTSTQTTTTTTTVVSDTTVPSETTTAATSASAEQSTTATTATTTATGNESWGELVITHEECNIRSDAGAKFDLMGVAYEGEKYNVFGMKDAENGVTWMEILLSDGRRGYVCSSFVRFDGKVPGAKAYLTFDDGPTDNTPKILDILDRYGVKATFFVIYHKGQESTYRAIVERGHTIALHSYSHEYSDIYKSEEAYFKDLDKLAAYIEKVTGQQPKILRFPGGSSNTVSRKYCKGIMSKLTAEVERRGYVYYDWNLDSGDASGKTVRKDKIVANVKAGVSHVGQKVVLMHDAAAKTTTVEALPEIIEIFQKRGYELLPLTPDVAPVHQDVAN